MDVCFLLDGSSVCHQLLNDIGDILDKVLHIEDGESSEMPVNGNPPKCLNKSVTFPISGATKLSRSSSPQEDEMPVLALRQLVFGECTSDVYTRSYSFPPAFKPPPPSAMKGSREKRGASIGKLTVTWAPDVYDPPPTSMSHFLSRGSKQRMAKKDKKNVKKGQKGKNSLRAGDSKKKKKHRRSSVSSSSASRCHDQPNGDYPHDVAPLCTNRFEIGGKETCGSSYFLNSQAGVHYSVTEAL